MIRVALITSDPGARRGVLEELAMFFDLFETCALQPADAANEILKFRADVILLDVQAVSQTDAQALTDVFCQTPTRGSFVCCCSGCPTDRHRIDIIEEAGSDWCPLPTSAIELASFIQKAHHRPHQDGIVDAAFLAALWDLVAEEESTRKLTSPSQATIPKQGTHRGSPAWTESIANMLARILRLRVSRA